jgi:hypothetical protein
MNEKSNAVSSAFPVPPQVSSAFKRAASLALMALATFSQGCAGAHDSANQDLFARVLTVIEKCDQLKNQACIEAQLGSTFHFDRQQDVGGGRFARHFRSEQERSASVPDRWWTWSVVETESIVHSSSIGVRFKTLVDTRDRCTVESAVIARMGAPLQRTLSSINRAARKPMTETFTYEFPRKNLQMLVGFDDQSCVNELIVRFPIEGRN